MIIYVCCVIVWLMALVDIRSSYFQCFVIVVWFGYSLKNIHHLKLSSLGMKFFGNYRTIKWISINFQCLWPYFFFKFLKRLQCIKVESACGHKMTSNECVCCLVFGYGDCWREIKTQPLFILLVCFFILYLCFALCVYVFGPKHH